MDDSKPLLVDDALAAELDLLARHTGATTSMLIEQARRSLVTSERDFDLKVDAGLANLNAGQLVDHQAVVETIRRICHPKS